MDKASNASGGESEGSLQAILTSETTFREPDAHLANAPDWTPRAGFLKDMAGETRGHR